jgi:Flp pilus assembly protein TadG
MHVTIMGLLGRLLRACGHLYQDRRGLALTEFALTAPIMITVGGYGLELANLSLSNMRVSQIAQNLADHGSRVGLTSSLATTQLRESDINDILIGARIDGAPIDLTTYGRVTLSSLENVQQSWDTVAVQRIHWQRCIGLKRGAGFDSTYGTTNTTAGTQASSTYAGTTAASGMGATGAKVSAPNGMGVMFVEINYAYQPLFGSLFVPTQTIAYTASFIVRDKRDYSKVYNPAPAATLSTCDLYNS